jgi:hypothetical protein
MEGYEFMVIDTLRSREGEADLLVWPSSTALVAQYLMRHLANPRTYAWAGVVSAGGNLQRARNPRLIETSVGLSPRDRVVGGKIWRLSLPSACNLVNRWDDQKSGKYDLKIVVVESGDRWRREAPRVIWSPSLPTVSASVCLGIHDGDMVNLWADEPNRSLDFLALQFYGFLRNVYSAQYYVPASEKYLRAVARLRIEDVDAAARKFFAPIATEGTHAVYLDAHSLRFLDHKRLRFEYCTLRADDSNNSVYTWPRDRPRSECVVRLGV